MGEREKIRRRAWREALGVLSRRSRSREEMARALGAKGYAEDVVEGVIVELESRRLLDDAALSRDIVREGQRRDRGRARVYADLRRRGIARELCEECLATHFDPSLEEAAALRRLGALLGACGQPRDEEELRKAARKLSARGFSPSAVRGAIACAENGALHDGAGTFLDTECKDS